MSRPVEPDSRKRSTRPQHAGGRSPDGLEAALKQCRKAARRGHKIAKGNLQETAKAFEKVHESLSGCLKSLENGSVRTPGVVDQLKAQLSGVVKELDRLQRTSTAALQERRQHLDSFSITLFGRTMAGKSTLMEILTRGDGHSIGTGAQRTTRDVRAYYWNGLEVTDVPGVAAFEGEEDEELAFKAAAQADMVLFLISDDAPQPVEAECLARIRRLGKPVLGICNIKVAVDDDEDLLLFLRSPDRHFDRARLGPLLNQFHAFADQHVPGKRVPFVVTHLRSRYIAEQPQYAQHRVPLLAASRFEDVESRIVREVVGRGTFLRVKSFIDGSVAPMMDFTDLLLEFSAQNSSSGRVLIDKQRQLREWSEEFRAHGQDRISTLVSKAMDVLRNEVPAFSEDHYEDRDAGERWKQFVESSSVNVKVENLQKALFAECKTALNEVARELKSELSLVASLSGDRRIAGDRIFNLKRAWQWGSWGLGAVGLAVIIFVSGPIGWALSAASAVAYIVSWFFDDREKKARRAREKLKGQLLANVDKMERDLRQNLSEWFHEELLRQQVYVLLDDLMAVTSGLFELADAQRTLAWTLNDRQKALGRVLIQEALSQMDAEDLNDAITDVARVPGLATMFLIEPSTSFPGQIRAGLERLLGEQIWFVINTQSQFSILTQAIGRGCDRNRVSFEDKIRVAHVPLDELDAVTMARVRLAQQLTGLHVMR